MVSLHHEVTFTRTCVQSQDKASLSSLSKRQSKMVSQRKFLQLDRYSQLAVTLKSWTFDLY